MIISENDENKKIDGDFFGNMCCTPTFFGKYVSYPNKLPKICVVPQHNAPPVPGQFIYDRSLIQDSINNMLC